MMYSNVRGVVRAMRWKPVEQDGEVCYERVDSGIVAISSFCSKCNLQYVLDRAWKTGCVESGCAHYADTLPTFYKKVANGWQMGSADRKVWVMWKKDNDGVPYGTRFPSNADRVGAEEKQLQLFYYYHPKVES